MAITREQLQFAAILLCVPLQYYAVHFWGSNEVSRTYQIHRMVHELDALRANWLCLEPWRKWLKGDALDQPVADVDDGESTAVEVLRYRERHQNGHFGSDAKARDPKPPHVQFRVGQVVKHKRYGYHGVIIAWDETAYKSYVKDKASNRAKLAMWKRNAEIARRNLLRDHSREKD